MSASKTPPAQKKAAIAHLDAFLDMLAAERGRGTLTLSTYRECLQAAADWLQTRTLRLEAAGSDDLRAWLEDTQKAKPPISAATQAKRLSALKQYYRFLVSEGMRADNPVAALDRPQARRRLPQPLSQSELAKLIAAAQAKAETSREATGVLRLQLLLELLYGGGLRAGEVVGLPRAAANTGLSARGGHGQPYLIVRGKGNKERIAPLSPAAVAALQDYLAALKRAEKNSRAVSPYLFPSRGASGHLTRQSLFLQLKDLARLAGIDPARVRPHGMRHAFATHLLEGGADLRSVQLLLGHADIGTTQIYTQVTQSRLAKTLAAHHPMARNKA